jgi:hypothetical protein
MSTTIVPCPCCKATNLSGPLCRRCKTDLTLLFELAASRAQLLYETQLALHEGDGPRALRAATVAHQLQPNDDSRKLLAAACLLTRDFHAAWTWYCAGQS